MSCHAHAQSTSALPVSSLTSETKNLPRKCACSGATKLSGPCEACSSKQLEPANPKKHAPLLNQKAGPSLSFGKLTLRHDFSKVPVHGNSQRPASAGLTLQPAITHQPADEETEKEEYSTEGIRMTLAGSGTCQNGGAASACNPANGVYVINANNNSCCTKPCSQKHEQTHVNDVTGWGCCAALSTAYNRPGADRNALVTKYNTWLAKVYDITECNALTSDVACADQMFTAKDCSGAGQNTDCCKDIVDYKANFGAQKATVCGRAPRTVEPCPAF